MRKSNKGFAYILLLILLVPVVIAVTYVAKEHMPSFQPKPLEQEEREISPSLFEELLKKGKGSPTFTITPEASPKPTPTSQPGLKQTSLLLSTPAPTTKISNPPIMGVSYPTQLYVGQTYCLTETIVGGNTSGLKRKHNINDEGWSSYTDVYKLCFEPKEGLNKISLLYKNSSGDESIFTRQFNFHWIQDIGVTISGQIYRDENCNGLKDSGETGIAGDKVYFFQVPQEILYPPVASNDSGNYTFSMTIKDNESVTLGPVLTSLQGYYDNPHFETPIIVLNSDNRTVNQDLPRVPNENFGVCQ